MILLLVSADAPSLQGGGEETITELRSMKQQTLYALFLHKLRVDKSAGDLGALVHRIHDTLTTFRVVHDQLIFYFRTGFFLTREGGGYLGENSYIPLSARGFKLWDVAKSLRNDFSELLDYAMCVSTLRTALALLLQTYFPSVTLEFAKLLFLVCIFSWC